MTGQLKQSATSLWKTIEVATLSSELEGEWSAHDEDTTQKQSSRRHA
jgi:hypothetical protein